MNLSKLIAISVSVVILCTTTSNLQTFQTWIWRAQAKLIYESRTETWGSPRFFPRQSDNQKEKLKDSKKKSNPF
ncbi:MAG: hypothetical protein JNM24_05850 [Bdellovibrionaceae bacterium]|nr:hypothetical protein [Pseudobdellovibrionaceae bacterium]